MLRVCRVCRVCRACCLISVLTLGIGVHYICAMTSPRCLRFASIRLRFVLFTEGTELFSFWVAADAAGKSRGFVAAGGPGYPGSRDD
jgi:hypothetical protein